MKLAVFAATGRSGRHVVDQAVTAGHEVTAIARHPVGLPARVRTVTADFSMPDPPVLESALVGTDAVLSALGPRNSAEYGIVSTGTQAIVDAMKASGVRRLVVVSVAGISPIPTPGRPNPPKRDPGVGLSTRTVLSPIANLRLGKHYTDVALMEDLLPETFGHSLSIAY